MPRKYAPLYLGTPRVTILEKIFTIFHTPPNYLVLYQGVATIPYFCLIRWYNFIVESVFQLTYIPHVIYNISNWMCLKGSQVSSIL